MAKKSPTVADPVTQDETTNLKKQQDEVSRALKIIEKNFSKTFKFICALRLDMVADQLDKIDKNLASKIDSIANKIEKAAWE